MVFAVNMQEGAENGPALPFVVFDLQSIDLYEFYLRWKRTLGPRMFGLPNILVKGVRFSGGFDDNSDM